MQTVLPDHLWDVLVFDFVDVGALLQDLARRSLLPEGEQPPRRFRHDPPVTQENDRGQRDGDLKVPPVTE